MVLAYHVYDKIRSLKVVISWGQVGQSLKQDPNWWLRVQGDETFCLLLWCFHYGYCPRMMYSVVGFVDSLWENLDSQAELQPKVG